MLVKKDQIFNLMDTNGRRSDVLNALKIYLEILEELKEERPMETWGTYPASLSQFLFYRKALEKSKDVFKVHGNYDQFMEALGEDEQAFLDRDEDWVAHNFARFSRVLDEAVEKRARHYTSNLVKMGFTDESRHITEAGYAYLRNDLARDDLEELLPLDNVNIILLRQLAKLKVFSKDLIEGKRRYYSPFLMALVLLLEGGDVDEGTFEVIIQGLGPYSSDALKEAVRGNSISVSQLEEAVHDIDVVLPEVLRGREDVDYDLFRQIFKSSKDNDRISGSYYRFFRTLKDFREDPEEETYGALLQCFEEEGGLINKAFGYGKAVFLMGNRGSRYPLGTFLEKNLGHPLLVAPDFVGAFYRAYARSKWVDGIREYSDTTIRLLSATGLFKFRNLPDLSYKEILALIFDAEQLRGDIFGEMTEEEYARYEAAEDCYFGKNVPLSGIFHYSFQDIAARTGKIAAQLGVATAAAAKKSLSDGKSAAFIAHIDSKYTKEKIMELLPLFSDRRKDAQIKKEVNDGATVPTIYEYIVGIAWYYISNREFDLYSSLNLTLNADFEPVIHAGGGAGDIVIHYEELVLMLEVTLMNKQAQKRGEWEPVLRHSLNLKADQEPKETLTFFIADELDYNTVNIWRAVAAASLESTNTHKQVDGVIIMPFTNREILTFLEQDVYYKDILRTVQASFAQVPQIRDTKWHEEILSELIS